MSKAQQAAREYVSEGPGNDHENRTESMNAFEAGVEWVLPEEPDPAVIEAMAATGARAVRGVTAHTNERDREFARAAYAALRGAMQ